MTTNYTQSLRLIQPGVGDQATDNTWGALLNTDMALLEAAVTGVVSVSLAGLSTYALTATNGAADQSRPQALILTGAPLSGGCTVSLPSVTKLGLVSNACSTNVTLTCGGGSNMVLPPAMTGFVPYYADGTNTQDPQDGANAHAAFGFSTFQVPAGVLSVKFTIEAAGTQGGASTSTQPGSGGGGGSAIEAWVPTVPGEIFTTVNFLGRAQVSSASGDVVLTANPGGAGSTSGYGGAGGVANTTGTSRPGVVAILMSGQQGSNGAVIAVGALHVGGGGGPSGLGRAGQVPIYGAPTNTFPTPNSVPFGSGGSGSVGSGGTPGTGGLAQITAEW